MSFSPLTDSRIDQIVSSARDTLKAVNTFDGMDEHLDQFAAMLRRELSYNAGVGVRGQEAINRVTGTVNYALASTWITHWPARPRRASFNTDEVNRAEQLRRAQNIAIGAAVSALVSA